jgi:hypothetical protein
MNEKKNPHLVPQSRNAWGLIEGIDYKTNEDGSINWRAMVKPEHLFPNKGWFELRKQQAPTSIEGLNDSQLLIKLAGIKELAKLRGYTSVKYDVIKCEPSYVSIKCGITWIPNYESEYESYYEDIANATVNNTSDFAVKFLETIAANRAFVRAVRNFLGVHIVGSDEIDASKKGASAIIEEDNEITLPSSQGMLEKTAKNSGINSFSEFQDYLREAWKLNVYRNNDTKVWTSYNDIPAKEARILMSILKDK